MNTNEININEKAMFLGPVVTAGFFSLGLLAFGLIYSIIAFWMGAGAMLDSVPGVCSGSILGAKFLISFGAVVSSIWLAKDLLKPKTGKL